MVLCLFVGCGSKCGRDSGVFFLKYPGLLLIKENKRKNCLINELIDSRLLTLLYARNIFRAHFSRQCAHFLRIEVMCALCTQFLKIFFKNVLSTLLKSLILLFSDVRISSPITLLDAATIQTNILIS